jgi:hypothetical protein
MCHEPPALGAHYVMNTPTSGITLQDGYQFFETLALFCSPFFYDTQRVYYEKNSAKTNLVVPKP